MIIWYPVLKLFVCLALLFWASSPIRKHFKRTGLISRDPAAYVRLAITLAVIAITPFRLQSPQQLEKTVQTYDSRVSEPLVIETQARQEYSPSDNRKQIDQITNEEPKQ